MWANSIEFNFNQNYFDTFGWKFYTMLLSISIRFGGEVFCVGSNSLLCSILQRDGDVILCKNRYTATPKKLDALIKEGASWGPPVAIPFCEIFTPLYSQHRVMINYPHVIFYFVKYWDLTYSRMPAWWDLCATRGDWSIRQTTVAIVEKRSRKDTDWRLVQDD